MGYPDMMRDIMDHARREEIKKKKKELENQTIIDNLTGFYNQKYFHLRLDQEMLRSRLYGNNLSLIFLAICNESQGGEKSVNPTYHETVNVISEIIGICLSDTIDLTFLYDRGKIAVILPEINEHEAFDIVESIQRMIRKEKRADIQLHAGVAQYNRHEYIEELIKATDDALTESMKSEKSGEMKTYPTVPSDSGRSKKTKKGDEHDENFFKG